MSRIWHSATLSERVGLMPRRKENARHIKKAKPIKIFKINKKKDKWKLKAVTYKGAM